MNEWLIGVVVLGIVATLCSLVVIECLKGEKENET